MSHGCDKSLTLLKAQFLLGPEPVEQLAVDQFATLGLGQLEALDAKVNECLEGSCAIAHITFAPVICLLKHVLDFQLERRALQGLLQARRHFFCDLLRKLIPCATSFVDVIHHGKDLLIVLVVVKHCGDASYGSAFAIAQTSFPHGSNWIAKQVMPRMDVECD